MGSNGASPIPSENQVPEVSSRVVMEPKNDRRTKPKDETDFLLHKFGFFPSEMCDNDRKFLFDELFDPEFMVMVMGSFGKYKEEQDYCKKIPNREDEYDGGFIEDLEDDQKAERDKWNENDLRKHLREGLYRWKCYRLSHVEMALMVLCCRWLIERDVECGKKNARAPDCKPGFDPRTPNKKRQTVTHFNGAQSNPFTRTGGQFIQSIEDENTLMQMKMWLGNRGIFLPITTYISDHFVFMEDIDLKFPKLDIHDPKTRKKYGISDQQYAVLQDYDGKLHFSIASGVCRGKPYRNDVLVKGRSGKSYGSSEDSNDGFRGDSDIVLGLNIEILSEKDFLGDGRVFDKQSSFLYHRVQPLKRLFPGVEKFIAYIYSSSGISKNKEAAKVSLHIVWYEVRKDKKCEPLIVDKAFYSSIRRETLQYFENNAGKLKKRFCEDLGNQNEEVVLSFLHLYWLLKAHLSRKSGKIDDTGKCDLQYDDDTQLRSIDVDPFTQVKEIPKQDPQKPDLHKHYLKRNWRLMRVDKYDADTTSSIVRNLYVSETSCNVERFKWLLQHLNEEVDLHAAPEDETTSPEMHNFVDLRCKQYKLTFENSGWEEIFDDATDSLRGPFADKRERLYNGRFYPRDITAEDFLHRAETTSVDSNSKTANTAWLDQKIQSRLTKGSKKVLGGVSKNKLEKDDKAISAQLEKKRNEVCKSWGCPHSQFYKAFPDVNKWTPTIVTEWEGRPVYPYGSIEITFNPKHTGNIDIDNENIYHEDCLKPVSMRWVESPDEVKCKMELECYRVARGDSSVAQNTDDDVVENFIDENVVVGNSVESTVAAVEGVLQGSQEPHQDRKKIKSVLGASGEKACFLKVVREFREECEEKENQEREREDKTARRYRRRNKTELELKQERRQRREEFLQRFLFSCAKDYNRYALQYEWIKRGTTFFRHPEHAEKLPVISEQLKLPKKLQKIHEEIRHSYEIRSFHETFGGSQAEEEHLGETGGLGKVDLPTDELGLKPHPCYRKIRGDLVDGADHSLENFLNEKLRSMVLSNLSLQDAILKKNLMFDMKGAKEREIVWKTMVNECDQDFTTKEKKEVGNGRKRTNASILHRILSTADQHGTVISEMVFHGFSATAEKAGAKKIDFTVFRHTMGLSLETLDPKLEKIFQELSPDDRSEDSGKQSSTQKPSPHDSIVKLHKIGAERYFSEEIMGKRKPKEKLDRKKMKAELARAKLARMFPGADKDLLNSTVDATAVASGCCVLPVEQVASGDDDPSKVADFLETPVVGRDSVSHNIQPAKTFGRETVLTIEYYPDCGVLNLDCESPRAHIGFLILRELLKDWTVPVGSHHGQNSSLDDRATEDENFGCYFHTDVKDNKLLFDFDKAEGKTEDEKRKQISTDANLVLNNTDASKKNDIHNDPIADYIGENIPIYVFVVPDHFPTLQAAVNAVPEDDYLWRIIVRRNQSLVCSGKNQDLDLDKEFTKDSRKEEWDSVERKSGAAIGPLIIKNKSVYIQGFNMEADTSHGAHTIDRKIIFEANVKCLLDPTNIPTRGPVNPSVMQQLACIVVDSSRRVIFEDIHFRMVCESNHQNGLARIIEQECKLQDLDNYGLDNDRDSLLDSSRPSMADESQSRPNVETTPRLFSAFQPERKPKSQEHASVPRETVSKDGSSRDDSVFEKLQEKIQEAPSSAEVRERETAECLLQYAGNQVAIVDVLNLSTDVPRSCDHRVRSQERFVTVRYGVDDAAEIEFSKLCPRTVAAWRKPPQDSEQSKPPKAATAYGVRKGDRLHSVTLNAKVYADELKFDGIVKAGEEGECAVVIPIYNCPREDRNGKREQEMPLSTGCGRTGFTLIAYYTGQPQDLHDQLKRLQKKRQPQDSWDKSRDLRGERSGPRCEKTPETVNLFPISMTFERPAGPFFIGCEFSPPPSTIGVRCRSSEPIFEKCRFQSSGGGMLEKNESNRFATFAKAAFATAEFVEPGSCSVMPSERHSVCSTSTAGKQELARIRSTVPSIGIVNFQDTPSTLRILQSSDFFRVGVGIANIVTTSKQCLMAVEGTRHYNVKFEGCDYGIQALDTSKQHLSQLFGCYINFKDNLFSDVEAFDVPSDDDVGNKDNDQLNADDNNKPDKSSHIVEISEPLAEDGNSPSKKVQDSKYHRATLTYCGAKGSDIKRKGWLKSGLAKIINVREL